MCFFIFSFSFVFLVPQIFCQSPCPEVLSIDISNGTRIGNFITINNLTFELQNVFKKEGKQFGCVCNIRSCLRKCCGPDEIMVNKTCTPRNEISSELEIIFHEEATKKNFSMNHHLIHNMDCSLEKMLLAPDLDEADTFYIQTNGSLYLPNFKYRQFRGPEDFCVEVFYNEMFEMNGHTSVIVCLGADDLSKELDPMRHVCLYGMIISMPFLLATFIAYALLPDRNLHMKALMFYVINLLLAYLLLVIIQLTETQFSDGACTAIGYLCLFFFLVSFFWMNVICIDIWFTFSGLRGFSGSKKSAARKRFLIYCVYATGMPSLHVSIVKIIDVNVSDGPFKPGIGNGQCFLMRGYPELLYFYGPMAILITINIIFFAITAWKIRNIKKETSMLKKEDSKRHSYENDKQTFNLYLKLLFAMGINWSMEIISWAVLWAEKAPDAIWYLTDFCNAIYGVFIFFIFVFKRSIWKLLKKRYYSFIGKPHLAHSMTMTNTRVTSYSTATSSIREDPHGVNDTSNLRSEA